MHGRRTFGAQVLVHDVREQWNVLAAYELYTGTLLKVPDLVFMLGELERFPVSTSSLRPSNSMICPGNGPKRPPEAPNADSGKPRIGHIFGYMAQNAIPRAPTLPQCEHMSCLSESTAPNLVCFSPFENMLFRCGDILLHIRSF